MKTWETEKQRADNALAESKAILDAMPAEMAAIMRPFVATVEVIYEAWQETRESPIIVITPNMVDRALDTYQAGLELWTPFEAMWHALNVALSAPDVGG